jgi:hypothetical protein
MPNILYRGKVGAGESDPLWSNVVLSCSFEGANNSTTFTDLTGKNTLTTVGNARITTSDKKNGNSCLNLPDNTSRITIPHSADWTFSSNEISVDFFMKKSGNPSVNFAGILDKITSLVGGFAFDLGSSTSSNLGRVRFFSATTGGQFPTVTSSMNVCDNQWHWIVGEVSGGWLFLFVDGVPQGAVNMGSAVLNNTGSGLFIGGDGASTNFMDGILIDSLRITNRRRYISLTTPASEFPAS